MIINFITFAEMNFDSNNAFYQKLEQFLRNEEHEYNTTHTILCYFVIERIYQRVKAGYRFGGIKIDKKERLIIDGNHRYIAYKLADIEIEVIDYIKNSSDISKNIKDIKIDIKEDWDKNNPKTQKYCTDEFLKDYTKV